VTVDGDTSTNDACMLIATGKSGVVISDEDESLFQQALDRVYRHLAQALIRDGEGATKFVEIQVDEASDEQEALNVAYTVAHSPLVKTALFASDPNWGRILAAVGRAGLHELDIDKIRIHLDDVCIVENGARASSYTEEQGQAVMSQDEIRIQIQLGRGDESCCVWTTDFSFDYVKINAEYRT
jgi:glutamate N-acetyltransferase/amino-acid N-acetyltransferase